MALVSLANTTIIKYIPLQQGLRRFYAQDHR